MKTIEFKKAWIGILVLPLLLISCDEDTFPGITGEGNVVTETLMLDDFTGFANAIAADIYLTQGDEQEVVIEAQQNIIDNLEIDEDDDGFWKIKNDRWVRRSKPVKIFITLPNLDKVIVAGSGDVVGDTSFENLEDLELLIAGSGSIKLDINCETLELLITGSGDFDLSGKSPSLDGAVAGSGSIRAYDLQTERSEISITGSGSGKLSVSEFLRATITGSGDVYYRGTPEVDVRVTGSGSVRKDQ